MLAQQIDLLLMGFGTALAGGHVHFYIAGTTTEKDVYSDKDRSSTLSNPLTLDTNGRYPNPVYGYGWYKLKIDYADDTNFVTWDNLCYQVFELDENLSGVTKTANYSAAEGDDLIEVNASTGAVTITLPDVTALVNSKPVIIKKLDATANAVTVKGYSTQNLDGVNTKDLTYQYEMIVVVPNPTKTAWDIKSKDNAGMLQGYQVSETEAASVIPVTDSSGKLNFSTTSLPAGVITMYGGSTAPSGYLLCNGQAVSRTTYADLFTAIGTTWGAGDGAFTFNVPDIRSRSPIGAGSGSGLTTRSLAGTGGTETHTLSEAEIPSHRHTMSITDGSGTAGHITTDSNGNGSVPTYTGYAGSGGAHANMHPWVAVNFIIKT